MDTKSAVSQKFHHMIAPADMVALMGNDVAPFFLWCLEWKINPGTQDTQGKGGINVIRQIDFPAVYNGAHQFPAQAQVLNDTAQNHQAYACRPEIRSYGHNGYGWAGFLLGRMGVCLLLGRWLRQVILFTGIHIAHRQIGHSAGSFRNGGYLRTEPVQHGQGSTQRYRAQQPKQHHRPQSVRENLGKALQKQPGKNYHQNHRTACKTHVQNLRKYGFHILTPA